jgi:hypothetical protein
MGATFLIYELECGVIKNFSGDFPQNSLSVGRDRFCGWQYKRTENIKGADYAGKEQQFSA